MFHLQRRVKKSGLPYNKQCFVIFYLPYSLLRSIGSHSHSRHRQYSVPSYSRLRSSSNPNWSTLGLDYPIQGLTSERLRRNKRLPVLQATEASSCVERGELSRSQRVSIRGWRNLNGTSEYFNPRVIFFGRGPCTVETHGSPGQVT